MRKLHLRRTALSILCLTLVIFICGLYYLWHVIKNQGFSDAELRTVSSGAIIRDERGVLLVNGSTWLDVIERQGFAVASERLFQMDLMRRKGGGALSELFGNSALVFDRQQRKEDWRHYAVKAIQSMPERQKNTCDAYARGVNSFITQYAGRGGVEYKILGVTPLPWSCEDSLLIEILMANNMTRSWSRDLDMQKWRDALPDEWWYFIFPLRHPWNRVWFDKAPDHQFPTIPADLFPATKLTDSDFQILEDRDHRGLDGSNSWAYRGKNGAWLANDPHLGYQVPQLWIPMRLSTTEDHRWMTGTSLPGVPGVLIGMNQNIAWAITNTAEDVDDAVIEMPEDVISTETREIKIKGGSSEYITVRKSLRGPIVRDLPDGNLVARQWLTLKPGILSLPIDAINHATSWDTFNKAINDFRFAPLSFTMLDRDGNMGLRISGCDIQRKNNGAFADTSEASQWSDDCDTAKRRRLYIAADNGQESAFISTANERLWIDDRIHNWSDDDRASRIRDVLNKSAELTADDMRLLQLDTTSRFHRELLNWLLKNGATDKLPDAQKKDWESWDGDPRSCQLCMSEADDGAQIFDQIIMKTVARHFQKGDQELPEIRRDMKRARVVIAMEQADSLKAIGINAANLASGINKSLARVTPRHTKPWQDRNHWNVQHPFVDQIQILGGLFAVDGYPQFGSGAAIRAERPDHGPSTRLLWQPSDPKASLWAFPTGVSGHVLSPHYKDWSLYWQRGAMASAPVLP